MKGKYAAAALLASALLAVAGAAEAAVAVVDMRAVVSDNPQWQKTAWQAAENRAALEREFNEKSAGLSGAELAAMLQEHRERIRRADHALMEEPYNHVLAIIEEVAKEQGYDMVVHARSVLYGTADGDITAMVKARMERAENRNG